MNIYDRFEAEYSAYHKISAARSTERLNLLRDLSAFAAVPIEQVTDEHLRAYLGKLVSDGYNPNTVVKKKNLVMPFFGWAFDVRLIPAEQLMRMQRVKPPRGGGGYTPRPYGRKEITSFWTDLDASWPINEKFVARFLKGQSRWVKAHTTFMHYQINAIAHLALHAGLRRDEIYNAPMDDIHYDNAYVVVRHAAKKNGRGDAKPREVPMTSGLASALEQWFERRALLAPAHDSPWLSLTPYKPRGGDMHTWAMNHERFGAILGTVGDGYMLHRLRHTCATEWLRSGMPLEQVSRLLGHANVQQTLAYADIIKTDLEKAMGRSAADFQTAVGRAA